MYHLAFYFRPRAAGHSHSLRDEIGVDDDDDAEQHRGEGRIFICEFLQEYLQNTHRKRESVVKTTVPCLDMQNSHGEAPNIPPVPQ